MTPGMWQVEKLKESNKKGAASGLPLRVAQVKGEDGRSQVSVC